MRMMTRVTAVLAAFVGTAALAAPAPLGPLSPDWPTALTFKGVPPRAQPRPGSACETADKYVTLISSDQATKIAALFSERGEFVGVDNKILHGRAEIAGFYDTVHQGGAIPLSFIDNGPHCIMELAGGRPSDTPGQPNVYKLVAIDHFTVGRDGRIDRLVIFFRPGAITGN